MSSSALKNVALPDDASGITIHDLAGSWCSGITQLHRHEYWEIFLFKAGSGRHLIDFEEADVEGCSVHFVLPHHVHRLRCVEPAQGLSLAISDDFFHASNENRELIPELGNYQLFHKVPILRFPEEEFNALWDIARQMKKENTGSRQDNAVVLKNYLNIFLCKCRRRLVSANASPQTRSDLELFITFRHFVEKHYQSHTKIQDYIKLLGVNEKKLFAVCSLYTGISPSDYLHKRILAEAKRLLIFSSSCQKEIAYTLNFTDLSHFMKFFKQKTGLLPKEFASRFLEKLPGVKNAAFSVPLS